MDESPNPDKKRGTGGAPGPNTAVRMKKELPEADSRRWLEML
jgi:hypothetical protein